MRYPIPAERLPFIQIFTTRRSAYVTVENIPATHSSGRSFWLLAATSFHPIRVHDLDLLFLHHIFVFDTQANPIVRIHTTAAYGPRSGLGYEKSGFVERNETVSCEVDRLNGLTLNCLCKLCHVLVLYPMYLEVSVLSRLNTWKLILSLTALRVAHGRSGL